MPEISRFLGIIITMYFNEHNPPHFHAACGADRTRIIIETLQPLSGTLPKAKMDALKLTDYEERVFEMPAAGVELDEPDAALHEPARQDAVLRVARLEAIRAVRPVEAERVGRLP